MMIKRPHIPNPLVKLAVSLVIVILSAYLLSSFFYRIDLTTEKRYTLSAFSKQSLRSLKDVVHVKVYLDGDLNIPFRKMQQRLRETLDEFRIYAGDQLEYEFINPFSGKNATAKNNIMNELYDKGLRPPIYWTGTRRGGIRKSGFPGGAD